MLWVSRYVRRKSFSLGAPAQPAQASHKKHEERTTKEHERGWRWGSRWQRPKSKTWREGRQCCHYIVAISQSHCLITVTLLLGTSRKAFNTPTAHLLPTVNTHVITHTPHAYFPRTSFRPSLQESAYLITHSCSSIKTLFPPSSFQASFFLSIPFLPTSYD